MSFRKKFDIAGLWAAFLVHAQELVPILSSIFESHGNDLDLDTAIVERQRVRHFISELEAQAKLYDSVILEGVVERGLGLGNGTYRGVPGLWVNVETRTTRKLDPKLLADNGVPSEIIAKCTVETISDPYIKVGEVREKKS